MNQLNTTNSQRLTCLYIRVSTQDQKFGMESQIRTLKEFCDKNKFTNYEIFADEGISGAKASRPSLDRMMKLVEDNLVERVVCYSFSRFGRSVTHLLNGLEKFKQKNVTFISYTESVDTSSPMGKLFFLLIAGLAQLERELIVERVKNGLKNAKAKGIHIGRKKTRPSDLIRQLLKKNLPYRAIAAICNTSSGSINAERKAMIKEEIEEKARKDQELLMRVTQAEQIIKEQAEADVLFRGPKPAALPENNIISGPSLPTVSISMS